MSTENRKLIVLGVEVRLGSREVESMLAARHGVVGERQIAFRGRLEHLRKLGCPTGVQTGKGKPAIFGWKQLIELGVALDLVNLGITPDEVSRAIKLHHEELRRTAAGIGSVGLERLALINAASNQKWPFSETYILTLDVGALSGLTASGAKKDPSIQIVEAHTFIERLEEAPAEGAAQVMIDFGTLVANLIFLVSCWSESNVSEAANDFVEWAEANVLDS